MNNINLIFEEGAYDDKRVLKHKKKILKRITLFSVLIFSPLIIKNIVLEYYALAFFSASYLLTLSMNAWAVFAGKKKFFNDYVIVAILVGCVFFTVRHIGWSALFWVYPVLIVLLFILPLRAATAFNSALIIAVSLQLYYRYDLTDDVLARVFISMVVTVFLVTMLLELINKMQSSLIEESIRDPLTGLLNRRQMDRYLSEAISEYHRYETEFYALVIDIDHFKRINDKYGHAVGDKVLKEVSLLISLSTRSTDKLFRTGGEEFLLLARGDSRMKVDELAEKLRHHIASAKIMDDEQVTISLGISALTPFLAKEDWVVQADKALYKAKRNGRNRFEIYRSATGV